ncbi:MAG: site-specific integrase, partial [Sinomicrobium sp.]|nr:site-specific integrase [Sinomicrobium sp.]
MSLNAFTDYLQLERNYSLQTIKAYRRDIESFSEFCKAMYDSGDINDVNYPQIRNWIVHLSEHQLSNRSINRKIASLKAYYKFLLKTRQIGITPLARHKSLKTPKKIEIPFSEKEMEMVLRTIDFPNDFEGVRNKLIIELLYATGMRRNELVILKTGDIDLSANTLKVLGKRNKERIIPLISTLTKAIAEYMHLRAEVKTGRSGEYLFLLK